MSKFNPLNLLVGIVLGASAVLGVTGYQYIQAETTVSRPGVVQNPPNFPPNPNSSVFYDDGTLQAFTSSGTPTSRCVNWATDLNKDCVINVGDQGLENSSVNGGSNYQGNPPTVTSTPTPTATNTPTPTPTATATPGGNSLALIIDSLDKCLTCPIGGGGTDTVSSPHQGTLCATGNGNVAGYDWQYNAADQDGTVGATVSGDSYGTGYATTQWDCNHTPTANVTLETRNFEGRALSNATGTWHLVTDAVYWCGVYSQNYHDWVDNCSSFTGPNWLIPTTRTFTTLDGAPVSSYVKPVSLHWASCCDSLGSNNTICSWVAVEARITGSGASSAHLLINTGFDYDTDGAGGTVGDRHASFFGKYYLLTGNWQWINGTSCTESQLTSNPPPF